MDEPKKGSTNRETTTEQREKLFFSKEQEKEINTLYEYIASVADGIEIEAAEIEFDVPEFDFLQ